MFYVKQGEGKNLVFLHGWGTDHRCFDALIKHFSAEFCVTAVDFSGHGNTPPPPKPFTIFDFCDTLVNTLKEAGIEKADFVCHSFGGRVGIILASRHPNLVNKLILTGAAGLKPKRRISYYLRVWRYKLKKLLVRLRIINADRLKNMGSADYKALSGTMKATFVSVVNTSLLGELKHIACPTLLLWGENDCDTPLYMAKKLNKHIADSGLVVIKNAGHYAYLDKPYEFRLIAQNFLRD